MNSRRPAVLLLAALIAALARPARADDAATAAAAIQALGQNVPGGAAAGAPGAKKKDSGGFDRELTTPKIEKKAGRKSAKKAKASKPVASKYKSMALSAGSEHTYRFNENGEPIDVSKKKTAAKKAKKNKKSSSDSDAEDSNDQKGACTDDEPCPARNADADAL